jgi:hypothetical protein
MIKIYAQISNKPDKKDFLVLNTLNLILSAKNPIPAIVL